MKSGVYISQVNNLDLYFLVILLMLNHRALTKNTPVYLLDYFPHKNSIPQLHVITDTCNYIFRIMTNKAQIPMTVTVYQYMDID